MFRLSRQLTTALLWLAIALLPLRGGLAVAMPHAMGAGTTHAVAQPTEAPAADTVSAACDEAAANTAETTGDGHANSAHTCSLCSLCHTAAAAAASAALHLPVLAPGGAPAVHASRDVVGAVFDAPERPPRLLA